MAVFRSVARCSLLVARSRCSLLVLVPRYSLLVARSRYPLLVLVPCYSASHWEKQKTPILGENKKTHSPVLNRVLLHCACTVLHLNTILFSNLFSTVITFKLAISSSYVIFIHSCYQHTFHNTHNLFLFLWNTLLSMFPFNMLL